MPQPALVFWESGDRQILTFSGCLANIRFFLALLATRTSPKAAQPFSVLVLPSLSSSLILGQPGASIFGWEQAARWFEFPTQCQNVGSGIQQLGASGGVSQLSEITPYTFRRGGASWYFTTYQWALVSSARGYIAQSVVELATVSLSKPTQMCIHGMRQVLPGVLPRSA